MAFAAVDVDGAEGTRGAEILTGAAADTFVGIHRWHLDGGAVVGVSILVLRDHEDGIGGAVAGTVAALHASAVRQTVVRHQNGKTDMDICFLLRCDAVYSTSRAHLAAAGTLRTAESTFERHFRLHQRLQFIRGTQHPVRAFADAELTCRAAFAEIRKTQGAGRFQRHVAMWNLLVLHHCQSAVDFFLLSR